MENKIKCIEDLLLAFKSRNEKLHEEIEKNDEAINDLENELIKLNEENNINVIKVA